MPAPVWVVVTAAFATLLVAVAFRRRGGRDLLVAAAGFFMALALAELGAWVWFVCNPVAPPLSGPSEAPSPEGIILPSGVLPAAGRLPGEHGQRPRVLFLGDSFTEGLGVPSASSFPSLVGKAVDVDVLNHGVTGTNTRDHQLLWRLYSRTWEPDAVVWVFVLNDLMPLIPPGPDYLMRFAPHPVLGSYLLAMAELVRAKRATQAQTIDGYRRSLDPISNPQGFTELENALTAVHNDLAGRGGRLVFAIFPLMWELGRYPFTAAHDNLAAAARRANAEVVDLLPAFHGQDAAQLWVSKFDHHPNERGHALVVAPLVETLRSKALATTIRAPSHVEPAQWLESARSLATPGAPFEVRRIAVILAAAAGKLAQLDGTDAGRAFAAQAFSSARRIQDGGSADHRAEQPADGGEDNQASRRGTTIQTPGAPSADASTSQIGTVIAAGQAAILKAIVGLPVITAGQESILNEIFGQTAASRSGCTFIGGHISGASMTAKYSCPTGRLVLEIVHPSRAPADSVHSERFAILVRSGTAPPSFLEQLRSRARSLESQFVWTVVTPRPWIQKPPESRLEIVLLVSVIVVPSVTCLLGFALLGRTVMRRLGLVRSPAERRSAGDGTSRRTATASWRRTFVIAIVRGVGLVSILIVAVMAVRAAVLDAPSAYLTTAGVFAVVAVLWLTLTGGFGYGSLQRADWIAILPFLVSLVVRQWLTLHSVGEIELQFAEGPHTKHSVVYALLQLFYGPFVRDVQAFTLSLNGILGALASLPLYLFVRQRVGSRVAGALCALFFAVHPMVARFAPTDQPYSLLLVTWFAGLALLSADRLEVRGVLGGMILLGIAATCRIEGVVILVASALLLGPKRIMGGLRMDPLLGVFAILVVASLGVVQMYFLLPPFIQSGAITSGFRRPLTSLLAETIQVDSYTSIPFALLLWLGAALGVLRRFRMGLHAFIATLIVAAPIAPSTDWIASFHRLVPTCALQAVIAGMGAYGLTRWFERLLGHRWLALLPGVLLALIVLIQTHGARKESHPFNDEYDMLRAHLAPGGMPLAQCSLMALNGTGLDELDLHDLGQVVPEVRALECSRDDCIQPLSAGGCFYYLRTAVSYFSAAGVPQDCRATTQRGEADYTRCLNREAAELEGQMVLEPVDTRLVEMAGKIPRHATSYPSAAPIGLFRARLKERS